MFTNGTSAIFCGSYFGAIFGNSTGCDIVILSRSNAYQTSYSNFGSSYKHADYPNAIEKAKSILV